VGSLPVCRRQRCKEEGVMRTVLKETADMFVNDVIMKMSKHSEQ